MAVEPCDRAREDRQLLAGVVADDADVAADLRGLRHELELGRLHELQLLRVVAEEAEVVDRIAIDRREVDFLLIEEHGLRAHGPRRHDVAIREDDAVLRVDDEPRGLRRRVALRVERARAVDLDRHDAGRDSLERPVPARRFLRRAGCARRALRDGLRNDRRATSAKTHATAREPRIFIVGIGPNPLVTRRRPPPGV